MIDTSLTTHVTGHVVIKDADSNEILLDGYNAVHPQNMARVMSRGLANETNSSIFKISLGNGGTHIDAGLNITYLTPNTTGTSAALYNTTYEEIVDDTHVGVGIGNSVISTASPAPDTTSVVTCTLELSADEPSGQAISDGTTTNPDSLYTFDELGLVTSDSPALLLTHIVFSPIEKTAQRNIIITYTLTISVS